MSFHVRLEIPLPPETLPLFHDAICTALCITIAEAGPEIVRKISIEYDNQKALSKVVIEGNIDSFNRKFDELFGKPKVKPSAYTTIDKWLYTVSGELISFKMGGEKYPWTKKYPWTNIAKTIRRQCYLFAKGYKYISIRDEKRDSKGLKPIKGYFKLGFGTPIITMLGKILRSSQTINVMGNRYTLSLLVNMPPKTVDEALVVSKNFYKVNYGEDVTISLNEDLIKHVIPYRTLNLLLEAPDLVYHNLVLNLVREYIQGTIDVLNLPSISIYVFRGGAFDEDKIVFTYLECNNIQLQELYLMLTAARERKKALYLIDHLNRAIQYLGELTKKTEGSKEFTIVETVIPHIRTLMNNLVSGVSYTESLYTTVRILKELERVDNRFKLMAEELLEIL